MNVNMKSQRTFAAVTLLTVFSVAMVLVVYAAVIGSMTGGGVLVGGSGSVTGTVYYSLDNNPSGTWYTALDTPPNNPSSPSTPWYARIVTGNNGYSGPATITWQLERKTATSWETVGSPVTTSITLTTTSQTIYTSGLSETLNQDWGLIIVAQGSVQGTYHVVVSIEST